MLYHSGDGLTIQSMGLLNSLWQVGKSAFLWANATLLASFWTKMLVWFNAWVFADWISLNWFVVLLMVDTISGAAMHIKLKTFSAKDLLLKTLVNKVFIAGLWFVLIHVVTVFGQLEPETKMDGIVDFFRNGVLFTYFLQSIIDNTIVLSNGKFPPYYAAWREKFGK